MEEDVKILKEENLSFIIERVNENKLVLTPRIKASNKQQREKLKRNARVCEVIVFDDAMIKRFENIVVVDITSERSNIIGKMIKSFKVNIGSKRK